MGIFVFDDIKTAKVAFNPNTDILSLSGRASDYVINPDASGNVTLMRADKTITLTGAPEAALSSANFLVIGSDDKILIGDDRVNAADDALGQNYGGPLDLVSANNNSLNGNNLIYGMGGGDTITTGNGDNLIFGGHGINDTTDSSDTIIINGAGATSGSNRIFANAGDDTILFVKSTGLNHSTTVWAGLGNDDVLIGAAQGTVHLFGNGGNDTLNASGSTGDVTIFGGNGINDSTDGADTLITGLGNAKAYGNAGADVINFDDFAKVATQMIYAGLGNDTVQGDADGEGSRGILQVFGNGGNDVIDVSSHHGIVTVFGGNGFDDSSDGADSITASALESTSQTVIYGNGGNDTITLTTGVVDGAGVAIYGGLGTDLVNIAGPRGAASSLTIYGNAGNDTFNINDSALTAHATIGFGGFEKSDQVNITLNGGSATDIVASGGGVSLVLDNAVANGKYVFIGYNGSITDKNFVIGDGSVLQINTGDKATLTGNTHGDQLIAGTHGDTLSGAGGNDILRGGESGDSISGGDGVDTIYGNEGNDTITAGDGGALGGTADSYVDGGNGADSITGGMFEDVLVGGTGHDTLIGGMGADTLTGGIGNDTFTYAVAEFSLVETDVDLVTDAFDFGIDRFSFSDLDRSTLRGTGANFASGDASAPQTLGVNVGMYVAGNVVTDFSKTSVFAAFSGIADDLATGDKFYALISNGVDARLVRITEVAHPGSLSAADDTLEYVARLNGVTDVDLQHLSAGNFPNFL